MQHLQPNTTLQGVSYNNLAISYKMEGLFLLPYESFVTLHSSRKI